MKIAYSAIVLLTLLTCNQVPCGTETEQKPPKCHKPCPVAPLCRHAPQSKVWLVSHCDNLILDWNSRLLSKQKMLYLIRHSVFFLDLCYIAQTLIRNCFQWRFTYMYLQPHRCHYGACPPCRLTCGEKYSCGHECQLRFASNYSSLVSILLLRPLHL